MLKFFPNKSFETCGIIKYRAFNGVLTALHYESLTFNAHLLVGLQGDNKLKSISFSYCKWNDSGIDESIFSLSFNEELQIQLTLNSENLYYSLTIKITEAILENIRTSILQLYCHPYCQPDSKQDNPSILLKNIFTCVMSHATIINAFSGSIDAIHQNIPLFIELLTSKFNEELERLNLVQENSAHLPPL